MIFEWDPKKAKINLKIHEVSFEGASLVFEDHFALERYDEEHSSIDEKRFIRLELQRIECFLLFIQLRKKIRKFFGSFLPELLKHQRNEYIGTKDMKNKEVILEVTNEQFEEMKEKGTEEAILKPGKLLFKRVSPKKVTKRKAAKIRINICLDAEIIHHFRNRAEDPNAAPYQTQINAELRKVMKHDLEKDTSEMKETAIKLLEDDEFLIALSEKLKEKELQTT